MAKERKKAKRRSAKGTGVFQRKSDGLWVATWTERWEWDEAAKKLKQIRRTFYGNTQAEAVKKRDEEKAKQTSGVLVDPTALTVAGFLGRWMETVCSALRGTTQERRRTYLNKHILPFLRGLRLNKLTLEHLESWLIDLAKQGRSEWTRHQAATMLSTALRHAEKKRLIAANPAANLTKPRPKDADVEPYTEEQVNQLLAANKSHRLHALYVLAVTTGMRQGELFSLHWPEINFDQATVTVKYTLRQLKKAEGSFSLEPPKSKRSRRTLDVPAVVLTALAEHRERMKVEGRDVENGPVFLTKTGTFIGKSNFTRQIHRPLLKRAKLPIRKFHALRHTHASILLSRGRSIVAVSQRLGHGSPEITLREYGHLMPGDGKETARLVETLFANYKGVAATVVMAVAAVAA